MAKFTRLILTSIIGEIGKAKNAFNHFGFKLFQLHTFQAYETNFSFWLWVDWWVTCNVRIFFHQNLCELKLSMRVSFGVSCGGNCITNISYFRFAFEKERNSERKTLFAIFGDLFEKDIPKLPNFYFDHKKLFQMDNVSSILLGPIWPAKYYVWKILPENCNVDLLQWTIHKFWSWRTPYSCQGLKIR